MEAIAQLSKGLELLADLPNAAERAGRSWTSGWRSAVALIAAKGCAAPEVGAGLQPGARSSASSSGRSDELFPVLRDCGSTTRAGRAAGAHDLAEQLVMLCGGGGDATAPCPGAARSGRDPVLPRPVCRCGESEQTKA